MFECLICHADMRDVVMDADSHWQPGDEVNCPDCAALHRIESNDFDSWLILLKSGAEHLAEERLRLRRLLQRVERYMEHTPACKIDRMPDLRCTCGEREAHSEVQSELAALLHEKQRLARGRTQPERVLAGR